jgi:hypothetical protein
LADIDGLQGIWICHHCEHHCDAKKKRCSNCKHWRHGIRGPMAKRNTASSNTKIKPAPKSKSNATRKRKDAPPATVVAIAVNDDCTSVGGQ